MTVAPNDFTHLHVHSEFSLLDGLGRITELVDTAAQHGMDSLAITDHGALYGAVAFYQAAKTKGIKPILGIETYVARRSMTDKEGKADSQPFHLILLAQDWTGYQNLCRLATDAHLDGYYYKPRIDREHLARHSAGLIGLSACLSGEVAKALEVDDWELARKVAGEYGDILGKDRFFLELQDHGMPEQRRLNEQLIRLAPEVGLPLVVTNDLHYVRQDQSEAHDVLLCVGTGNNLDTPNRMKFDTPEFYVKSAAQMAALFPDQLEAIRNTRRIAEMTDIALPLGQLRIPHFPVPDGHTVETWLRAECQRGLETRYGTVTPELQQRLDYELGVIIAMGYPAYFLIVADFIRFAREQGIQTTCRGSAPGSIVTYTLGITPVDPILYQLPFERFLNPDRVTMPDIDVDFEDGRRDEVIAYVGRKYGQDHVAQIITFGTMLAKAAIRDVGRVLGHSYGEVDRIAKAVPGTLGMKLDEAITVAPALREMVESDPGVKRIIDFARHLEGVARNASTHAAGVVISREPLTELMPLQKATNSDGLMTQYEMHAIEALGLLKFDFLGLSNLTILRQAVDLVQTERGTAIDLDAIPLDDARTFELLASGETTGIFQLESPGMRRYIRELRPTSVYDLAAMVALYRPGPMDNIPSYIRRKHGQEPVTYLHPLLEPYLEKTYGIFVYQEDIMSAAIALGGFTGPEADTLGYAIRKKKSAVLRAQKERFVTQAAERGVAPKVIDDVFAAFEPFERYGFNKAHATCYGLIAYQTAYLKANYTVEYMTSVLTAFRSNEEKVAAAIAECRRLGIAVLPPDVALEPPRVHGRRRGDPVRPAGGQERRPGGDRVDHRRPRRGRALPVADRLLHADRPAPVQPQGARGAHQGRGARLDGPSRAAPARSRRRDRLRPGDPARPGQRPDVALRPWRRRRGRLRTATARRDRGPDARAAALGEGAAGPLPVGAPDGRGRRAGRAVRERVLGRPEGRVPRGPAHRRRWHRHRRPDRRDEAQRDDGDRDARGPAGLGRGGGLPAPLRDDPPDMAGRLDPARGRPGRPPRRGELGARRPRPRLGRCDRPRPGGVRRRGRRRRSRAARARTGRTAGRARVNGTATARAGRLAADGARRPGRPESDAGRCRGGAASGCARGAVRLTASRGGDTPLRCPRRALPPIAPAEPIPTYQEPGGDVRREPDDHEEPALPDEARAREAALATASTSPTDVGNGRVLKVRFLGRAGRPPP